ncbi:MAG: type I methionyl aminopeptidase [Capsulimonadaceae bacterium]|nr:type I methionyl aminopeptidase [Capsulimonadaceae bacterium]
MVRLKSAQEIEMMRLAGRVVAEALTAMRDAIVPDVTTTQDLDDVAAEVFRRHNAKSAFLGYRPSFSDVPYRHNTCISVNEQVVHGIPGSRVLRTGDIVSLDTGAAIDGWYGDSAITVPVGEISSAAKNLLTVTQEAMFKGIAQARPGNRIEDISAAVQRHAERARYGVVRSLVGHGIGREPHEEPQVPNYGRPGRGMLLKPGMVICIEPMINARGYDVAHVPGDDWTIVTSDRSLSAHFEHTVAITENGPDLLTLPAPRE